MSGLLRRIVLRTRAELELRSFARRYGRAIADPGPAPTEGVALLTCLTYFTLQFKLQGMFAKALQLRGLDVVCSVPDGSKLPARYMRLFGISRFVEPGSFLPPDADAVTAAEARRQLDSVTTFEEVKELSYHGALVGRQALSTASRHLHEGALDLADPEVRASIERLLALAIQSTLASEAMLKALAPRLVLFNERNYALEGPLSDVALERGSDVVQFVSGFDEDSLVFKRYTTETRGVHPRSLSDASWERVRHLPWDDHKQAELDQDFDRRYATDSFLSRWNHLATTARPRDELVRALGLDATRRTAVLFSHVLWDANMFYGRDLFRDQEAWFVETVRAACANDAVNWIVKLHPANAWKLKRDGFEGELSELTAIREHIGELPAHVQLLRPESDIDARSLFALTDWGITIRGSVGFELPCFGVPALTAGTGFYSGRGFTIDSDTAEEYLERLRTIQDIPPLSEEATLLARRHAYALFRLRQSRFTSFRTIYGDSTKKLVDPGVEIRVRTPEELARSEDLARLGTWLVESHDADYLELAE
ncbi:MAG: hypothetical protein QOC55_2309 [Thermoleophilaceae bacterium]|nr:hypothetical protein [Thermoleophilaceae bacterium]